MITLLIALTIKTGHESEFEKAFIALARKSQANEPGSLHYRLYRMSVNGTQYRAIEDYASQEALDIHNANLPKQEELGVLMNCMAAAPVIELMSEIAVV